MVKYMRPQFYVLLAVLGGCTVGPNYRLPAQDLINNHAAQARFVSAGNATQIAEPPDNWWHLFNDPTLDRLIRRALAANTDLRVAQANLERSNGLLAQARVAQQINATVDLDTSYEQLSAESFLQGTQPPPMQLYNTGIAVSYDVDLFGGIRRGIEAATDDTEASQAARDLVRVNVAAETTRAYAEICNAGNELSTVRRSVELQDQSLAFTRQLSSHGRAVSFDIDRAQGQVEALQARIPLLQARQVNAAYRLNTLMGEPPATFDRTWLGCHQPLRLKTLLPVGDGRSLLKRRPDVRAAERRLAAATARIGVATAALYPDIRLGASLGSTGAAADLFSPLTNRFGIGPMISWNINQNDARARIMMAKAQTRGSLASFDGTVLAALREVETSLNSYGAQLDRDASLTAARDHAAQVAATMEDLHRGGRLNALVALDAERKLATADQAVAEAESAISQSQISVFLALGGGWNTPAHP